MSEEIRKRIIAAFLDDWHPDKIARLLGCHRTTVDRVIKKYNSTGTTTPKKRGGYKPKMLNAIHQETIQSYIDANCSITLDGIKNKLVEQYSIKPSLSTIDRTIRAFSYTLKRVSLIPERRNETNTLQIRFNYAREFFTLLASDDGDNILFLDEVGFNISMRSKRGEQRRDKERYRLFLKLEIKISLYVAQCLSAALCTKADKHAHSIGKALRNSSSQFWIN